jgi:hypothetical protein
VSSLRRIEASNFSNNVGGSDNLGNDFCDLSSSTGTAALYTSTAFVNIISSSSAIRFYHMAIELDLDCLLNNSCNSGTIYVSSTGQNSILCGLSASSPCLTIDYAWSSRVLNPGIIFVDSGDYGIAPHEFTSTFNMAVEGTKDNVVDYPKVYPNQASDVWFYLYYDSVSMILTFTKLNILRPTSDYGGFYFSTYYSPHYIYIDSCVFSPNATSTINTYGIFLIDWGFFLSLFWSLLKYVRSI